MPHTSDKHPSKYNNFVHNDAIWRQNIHNETLCAKRWDLDFGFLKGGVDGQTHQDRIERANAGIEPERLKLPPIVTRKSGHVDKSAAVVPHAPRTTASEVGWVSGITTNNLERYGAYAKGRRNVERFLGWTGLAI
eukprot:Opistho-1_new@31476